MVEIFFWPKRPITKKYYFYTEKRVQEWFQSKMADKFLNKKM